MPLFRKVLIANRGEIAVRIARGLRDLSISPIAVYSDADRGSPHVRAADEAYRIGPPPAAESYLNIDRIIEAAKGCGAEAVHPGYGFLSEDPRFARAVADAGLVWIGPPASAMELTGDKLTARKTAADAGVPTLPGSACIEEGMNVAGEAKQIGYPLLVKAAGGGGGKGMRLVRSEDELEGALRAARSEGKVSFGDDRIYLEHYVERPRHVEVQILGDQHGSIVHLGERDCSVQRRHQKVVEESPSPELDDATRETLCAAAVKAARASGYQNAGTCEFLLAPDGRFFFLEMNARLQVEHPVTELRTGLDLVELQIRIAAGEPLPFTQDEVSVRGHAIEVRIYAEDPDRGYMPSPGDIQSIRQPSGPGVRVDSGIDAGVTVTPNYDPILSKLIVWGETREQALGRLTRALSEYRIGGIVTNLSLHRRIVADARFVSGKYDTSFLETLAPAPPPSANLMEAAALAAALYRIRSGTEVKTPESNGSLWKRSARLRSAWERR